MGAENKISGAQGDKDVRVEIGSRKELKETRNIFPAELARKSFLCLASKILELAPVRSVRGRQ
jgi:hypothetical protein